MPALQTPPRLYSICLEVLVPWLVKRGARIDWEEKGTRGPLDNLACRYVEDLLLKAYTSAANGKCLQNGAGFWNEDWRIFLNRKISYAILPWEQQLLRSVAATCRSLRRVLVCRWKDVTPEALAVWLPPAVLTLDFDGELFYRSRRGPDLEFTAGRPVKGWLPEAETILKALQVTRQKIVVSEPLFPCPSGVATPQLAELHLGTVGVTPSDLQTLLGAYPNLRLLRHYQLVTALYLMHADAWRRGDRLPVYKLKNLDVDFSHVVRCRMSPEPVVATDALHLATRLCPDASMVRVRYDCETPHDVLDALTSLRRVRELSVVCVSSGQRTLLDFSDIRPILEQHGPSSMTSLELKVIEEIDVHVIMVSCPKLERLTLSGCGNVTPATCHQHHCASLKLRRLRLLFFADGDDFSWDHNVPQCFWRATLGTHERRSGDTSHHNRLEGVFLESPRICPFTANLVFPKDSAPLFPELQVLSLCRCPELTLDYLAAMCGVDSAETPRTNKKKKKKRRTTSLRYVRVTQCAQVGEQEHRSLKKLLQQFNLTESIVINVNSVG